MRRFRKDLHKIRLKDGPECSKHRRVLRYGLVFQDGNWQASRIFQNRTCLSDLYVQSGDKVPTHMTRLTNLLSAVLATRLQLLVLATRWAEGRINIRLQRFRPYSLRGLRWQQTLVYNKPIYRSRFEVEPCEIGYNELWIQRTFFQSLIGFSVSLLHCMSHWS